MSKLYLVRRNLETIIGPHPADRLKSLYERMDFTAQDEICGNCGPWIMIEHKKDLKACYPELVEVFYKDSSKPMSIYSLIPKKIKSNQKQEIIAKQPKHKLTAGIYLAIAIICISIATVFVQKTEFSAFISKITNDALNTEKVAQYFQKGDIQAFNSYMSENKNQILEDILKSNDKQKHPWMPYLRFYVFQADGEMQNLSFNDLRGDGAVAAPLNCSYKAWLKNWKKSARQWGPALNGKFMPREDWMRVLMWNPYWIKRRTAQGWYEPQNYYGACIFMAYRAFDALVTDNTFMDQFSRSEPEANHLVRTIAVRLAWLSSVVNKTQRPGITDLQQNNSILGILNCLERASFLENLDSCKSEVGNDVFKKYIDHHYALNLQRMLTQSKPALQRSVLNALASVQNDFQKIDSFTRLDMTIEDAFMQGVLQSNGDMRSTIQKIQQNNPEIRFLVE